MIALVALAGAESLESLLSRGEVALLETRPDGRLRQATAIGLVRRPIEEVWAKLIDVGDYENWMPAVADSTVVSSDENSLVADIAIAIVGPNVNFREEFILDPAARVIHGKWVSGALRGSHWEWRLVASGENTLVYRSLFTNVVDSNWLVRQAEDEHHTLEYGINVATGMVEMRGLKKALGVP